MEEESKKKKTPKANIVCEVNEEINNNEMKENSIDAKVKQDVVRLNPDPHSLDWRG